MKTFKQYVREETDKKDTITFDIPLLIRVLELAREDIKSDVQLHKVVEKLIDIRDRGTLTMDDYETIAKLKEHYSQQMEEIGSGSVGIPGPTNVVGSGDIAGTGGKGGEPGVKRFKKNPKSPVMMGVRRGAPNV